MKSKFGFALAASMLVLALAALPGSAAASTNPSPAQILRQSTRTVTFPQIRDRANLAVTTTPTAQVDKFLVAAGDQPPSPAAPALMRKGGGPVIYLGITASLLGVVQAII